MVDDDRLLQTAEAVGACAFQIDRLLETDLRVFNVTAPLRHI